MLMYFYELTKMCFFIKYKPLVNIVFVYLRNRLLVSSFLVSAQRTKSAFGFSTTTNPISMQIVNPQRCKSSIFIQFANTSDLLYVPQILRITVETISEKNIPKLIDTIILC